MTLNKKQKKITNNIQTCLEGTIPKVQINREEERLFDIVILAIKECIRRLWQKIGNLLYKNICNQQTHQIRKTIREHRNLVWTKKFTKLNIYDKSQWRATKMFERKYQNIPTLEKNTGSSNRHRQSRNVSTAI